MITGQSTFGSINYACRNIEPPKGKVIVDNFDYDKLLAAITDEWELAGPIAKRIGMRAQHIGKRLWKLHTDGKILRATIKIDIYWRLP